MNFKRAWGRIWEEKGYAGEENWKWAAFLKWGGRTAKHLAVEFRVVLESALFRTHDVERVCTR